MFAMIMNIGCRFTAFADYSALSFSQERMTSMFKTFENFNLIPYVVQQFIPDVNNSQRMRFITDKGLSIAIMGERIDIEFSSHDREGFSENEKNNTVSLLLQCMQKIYNNFAHIIPNANRLAWGDNFVYSGISSKEKENFRNYFLKPVSFYEEIITDEFNVQYSGRKKVLFDNSLGEENVNVLTSVMKYPYVVPSNIDGYLIMFDINTIPENKKNRFSFEYFQSFIENARKIQCEAERDFLNV